MGHSVLNATFCVFLCLIPKTRLSWKPDTDERRRGTSIDVNEQKQHLRDFSAVEEIAVLIVLGLVSARPGGSVNHEGTQQLEEHLSSRGPPDYRGVLRLTGLFKVQHIPVG